MSDSDRVAVGGRDHVAGRRGLSFDPSPIFDPRTYTERMPYELFAFARREAPVLWMDEPPVLGWPAGPGFWGVFLHADVKTVLRDPASFSSHLGGTQIRDPASPGDLAYVQRMMLNMDPPEHTRIRSLISKSFTPKAVARLEDRIARRAAELVAAVADRDQFDFTADLAADLPLFVLAEVMGVPESDRYLLFDWSNRVIGYQDEEYATSEAFDATDASPMAKAAVPLRPVPAPDGRLPNPRSRDGMPDLYCYAHELAAYKRRHLGDDVMSILLRAEHEGGAITTEEFENLFWLFAVAGNETLRNGIPGGMACLLDHPEEYRRLREDPSLVASAVEEMLRYWPPVIHFRRTATVDCELRGQPIAAGDKVVVYHASANRDETVFSDPDRFDITRRPNDHVSFGFGVHFCLGAHLARTQMRAIFRELVTRLPELERAGPVVRLTSNFQNGVKHLRVRRAA